VAAPQADLEIVGRILPVLKRIEQDLSRTPTIDELARDAYYSRFHFQRLFRQVCGRPLGDYLRSRRMTRAAELLLGSRWDLQRVADEVGYESVRTLHKAFLAQYGTAPLHYRQARREQWHRSYEAISADELLHLHSGGVSLAAPVTEIPARNYMGASALLPMDSADSSIVLDRFLRMGLLQPATRTEPACFTWSSPAERLERRHHIAFMVPLEPRVASSDAASTAPSERPELFTLPPLRIATFRHHGPMATYRWSKRFIWQEWGLAPEWEVDEDQPSELRFRYLGLEVDPTGFDILLPVKLRAGLSPQPATPHPRKPIFEP